LGRIGLPAWTTREAPASNRRGFYSHGEYRHCAAEGSAADTGREGSAADTGRRECTRATPNVQQWLVPSQIRCALGNLARASLSVMQAGEPLAGDSPTMIATATIGIMRIVVAKATSTFILPTTPMAADSSEYCEGAVARKGK
jgi:hypothetical protein